MERGDSVSFQRFRRPGIIMLFVAFCFALLAPSASAQTDTLKDCDQQVLDFTAGKVLHEDPAIHDAMNELQSQGVDVRIRAFDTTPNGSLDAYEATQVAGCPSWGLNGQIKPNLLVVLDSLDHQDAIFYGKNFSEKMQPEVDAIRAAMQSPNQEGKYSTAVAAALHDSSEVIKGNSNPANDGWPVWVWILIIVVGLALLIGVIGGVIHATGGGGRGRGYGSGSFFVGGSSGSGSTYSCGGGSSGSW